MEELLTPQEAARFLKISVRDLRRLCQQRKISYCQISARRRHFTKSQLQDYLGRVTVPARERMVDRRDAVSLPSPRKGGEKAPTSLQGNSGKGFSDIRKELSTL
jgi:excisionase family DNA binding protein